MLQNLLTREKYKILLYRLFKIIAQYIFFYLIFTCFISLTEFSIINFRGGNIKIIDTYCRNFTDMKIILIFLILFIALNVVLCVYDKLSIKILNEKLKRMKRRVNNNV